MSSLPRVYVCRQYTLIRALSEDGWVPPPKIEARVDELWSRAAQVHGSMLADGAIFSLVGEANPSSLEVSGRFIKYRYYAAQCLDPSLEEALKVRPLAVTAIVRCVDGLAIGRRVRTAAHDADLWELIPAGGIEPDCVLAGRQIDPRLQVCKEIREEFGINGVEVESLKPLFWMVEGNVTDFVYTLELDVSREMIQGLFDQLPTREHSRIDFLPLDQIRYESGGAIRIWSASTRALLEALLANGFV